MTSKSSFITTLIHSCFADVPHQSPAEWAVENLVFDEAGNHGPFRTLGYEYVIEPLNDFANASVSDEVLVWGSQTHKTGTLMGGVAWSLCNDPCGFLWVMPSLDLARKFSGQRWKKMLEASDAIRPIIPTGGKRHDFSTMSQMLGASTINFMGSNSAANLASNPCRRVILDEVDKFDAGGRGEADAVELAEQRTKDQVNPQRWKTSTPTLYSGLIWQAFLKGDQRRYHVPCPHCGQLIVFAWSEQYTVLPRTGKEAWVKWDGRREDGSWDYDEVKRTARFECPHCKQGIRNDLKTKMIREGKWIATNPAAPRGYVSRHLSSLYSTSPEVSIGTLAVKFLQALQSVQGLHGFINGDLAEPDQGQDQQTARVELITSKIDVTAEWKKLLTADCQARRPYHWYVVRAWSQAETIGLEAGPCDTIDEIRAIQQKHSISDIGVSLDSGWGARTDAEIYQACARFGEIVPRSGKLPLHLGWLPSKGMPSNKRWRDPDTGLMLPWFTRGVDPFLGTTDAGKVEMTLFEFSGHHFKDVLDRLRTGKINGFKWSVSEDMATAEYWKHMDSEYKKEVFSKLTNRVRLEWVLRDRHWPNHLKDCEVTQLAMANFYQIFTLETDAKSAQ
jgi:hypothetical protein